MTFLWNPFVREDYWRSVTVFADRRKFSGKWVILRLSCARIAVENLGL